MKERQVPTAKKRFVVVTTEHRGVFGGYLNGSDDTDKTVSLTEAQMCVYWHQSVRGVLGLASTGPLKGSRVSPAVPKITLQGVTLIMDATSDAEKAWQSRPWN
jgi:hypothetical protein